MIVNLVDQIQMIIMGNKCQVVLYNGRIINIYRTAIIILLFVQKMGCANTRDQVYEEKKIEISNRDINEENDQFKGHHSQIQNYACGYSFSYKFQNVQTSSSPNKNESKAELDRAKAHHFMEICDSMKKHFQSLNIDEAFRLREQVKKQYNEIDPSLLPKQWTKNKEEYFVLMEQIEEKYNQLASFQKQLLTSNAIDLEQLKLNFQKQEEHISLCVSTQINIPLDLMVATFASFLRYSQFIKFSKSSKEIKRLDIFRRVGEVCYDYPFCSKNSTFFQSTVYNRLNHDKSVLVCLQSLYKNAKLCQELQYFPIFESQHHIQCSSIVCKLQYLTPTKTSVNLLFKIKAEIQGIAEWILEKMYKNMAIETMKKFIERANTYGEDTASESYQGDDEVYHYFHKLLKGGLIEKQ